MEIEDEIEEIEDLAIVTEHGARHGGGPRVAAHDLRDGFVFFLGGGSAPLGFECRARERGSGFGFWGLGFGFGPGTW